MRMRRPLLARLAPRQHSDDSSGQLRAACQRPFVGHCGNAILRWPASALTLRQAFGDRHANVLTPHGAVCQHGGCTHRSIPLGVLALGAAGLGYAAGYEVRSFRLRRVDVPVLPADQRPLRILHLSDIHLTPSQHKKLDWLRSLAELQPDLVVNTGDNLAHQHAVEPLLEALDPLLRPFFVIGSNDYYAPRPDPPDTLATTDRGTSPSTACRTSSMVSPGG